VALTASEDCSVEQCTDAGHRRPKPDPKGSRVGHSRVVEALGSHRR
jgi:hypothetical protein